MVVVIETGRLQLFGLFRRDHSQGRAGLQAGGPHFADHLGDDGEVLCLGRAISGAHAEPGRTRIPGALRAFTDRGHLHECVPIQTGVVTNALRAVRTVLRAASRLDRQERAHLYCVRHVMSAMHALRMEQQIQEGQRKLLLDFLQGPVVANHAARPVWGAEVRDVRRPPAQMSTPAQLLRLQLLKK